MSGQANQSPPVWQRFIHNSWQSIGSESATLESSFSSEASSCSLTICACTLDFQRMLDITNNAPIRRLSSKETPDVIYEWEESSNHGNSIWTPYNTDDCEAISISQRAGRTEVTLFGGHHNTPYEINIENSTQRNIHTNHVRWIRKLPPVMFSASPSAIDPNVSHLQMQVSSSSLAQSAQNVIDGATQIITFEEGDACPICLEDFDPLDPVKQAWQLRECSGHFFHAACIKIQLTGTGKCAVCSKAYIVQTGDQPYSGTMTVDMSPAGCGLEIEGYEMSGTIIIRYHFPSGVQGPDHPNPGVVYYGTTRYAFLPDIPEGRVVLELLKICFQRRLTFTVGRSLTSGLDNSIVWNGVHHKTSPRGGTMYYGWPDGTYFFRVKEELKAKGITTI